MRGRSSAQSPFQYNRSSEDELRTVASDFDFSVQWTVDNVWKGSDENFQHWTGITDYMADHSSSPFYDYFIEISAKKFSGFYQFTDGEGDEYRFSVFDTTADHVLRYNSGDPRIVRVTNY